MTAAEASGIIAIAGAGIAGLSAAIALKLEGFPVSIFEREASLQAVGAGIQLGPNATRIMESWNLDLLGTAFEPEAIELRNARSGALLNTIPLRRAARMRYGAPYVTLLRADLQRALLNRAAELEIPVNYGAPISKATPRARDVAIEVAGATSGAAALIGADGLNSSIRKLFTAQPRVYSAQAVAWRAMAPLSAVPASMRSVTVIWMGSGAHLVHYPVSGGSQVNAILVIDDVYRSDAGSAGSEALPYLLKRIDGWAGVPRSIVSSTQAWLHWRMYGVEKWQGGDGRIQLIGDAWHAMRPHLASGGVMAIEDAAALAKSLKATGDIPACLRRFRDNREARVWRVVRASALMGRIYNLTPPFDMLRNLVINSVTGAMLLSRNDWLYGLQREGRPN